MFSHDRSLPTPSSSSSPSFIQRRLTSLSLSRTAESAELLHGSLGLNLLHEPSDPHFEIIFVHGLRGGSRKTWSFSTDPATYWPKEWLPSEARLKHARIHSYGYNSDWGDRKASILSILDFGQALLADIQNSPHIRNNKDLPLVFVCHSMGGLVVKKAYLLAKQDPLYSSLLPRFHTMIFLATPHRGAESAHMLNNILKASITHGIKAFVQDLIPNSGMLQGINDDFRHVDSSLRLWSFFETIPTNLGYSHELIVNKDSAMLGLPGEHIQHLNADHRHICKFSSLEDPNYTTVLNAITSTVDIIEGDWSQTQRDMYKAQLKIISDLLHVFDKPESDLSSLLDSRLNGTCRWLISTPSFNSWQHEKHAPKYLWLNGQPATGKSTLASHVIEYLRHSSCDYSYFFFKHGDKTRSTIAGLLRSLAYQMALASFSIRQELLAMIRDAEFFDKDNDRVIWRTIFLTRIFRVKFNQPHYWIIDAVDECSNHTALFSLLSKVDKKFPLRVFISSRPSSTIERLLSQENIPVLQVSTNSSGSREDIKLFVEQKAKYLVDGESECRSLVDEILSKSDGCFLWTALVLKELETTHGEQQKRDLLKSVPSGMDELYLQILDGLALDPKNKSFAQAILRWVICAVRPLTIEELSEALRLDIGETFPRLESALSYLCGNLVYVDNNKAVQVVHQTVRAFLTREDFESEFKIKKSLDHFRIAEVCLNYLSSDELKPSRIRKIVSLGRQTKRSAFVNYAAANFSEHVLRSTSSADSQLILLEGFLKSNVVSWIEIIARSGSLLPLTRTAKNLKSYLQRRAKYRSPLGKSFQEVDSWSDDLFRLVPAFGECLLGSPAAIHFLIPSVCPPESLLYQRFANYPRSLKVVGISEKNWDDRLSCITFSGVQAISMDCQDGRLAIGLMDGSIMLYHSTSCEKSGKLSHVEPVRTLKFATKNMYLASSGRKSLVLWNVTTGFKLWECQINGDIMTLQFNEDDTVLRCATKKNLVSSWDVSSGSSLPDMPFSDYDESALETAYQRPPLFAEISVSLNILAVGYRQRPISFWDLEDGSFIGQYDKSTPGVYPGPLLVALLFNPNPKANLFAASYHDGDLVVFDPWTQTQIAITQADAHTLAVSPDGRTLATGDGNGTLQLFDFETLQLMYKITAYDHDIRSIAFTSNSLRYFDIRGDHCNIWEPSVLIRRNHDGDEVESEPHSEELPSRPQILGATIWEDDLTITAIARHSQGDVIFGGRENGNISIFSTTTGQVVTQISGHTKDVSVLLLDYNSTCNLLVSTDISSRYIVRNVSFTADGVWKVGPALLDGRVSHAITQILLSPDGQRLLVSTMLSDECWDINGNFINNRHDETSNNAKWVNHPDNAGQILLFNGSSVRIFDWQTFVELSSPNGLVLDVDGSSDQILADVVSSSKGHNVCVRLLGTKGTQMTQELRVWPASTITPSNESVVSVAKYKELGKGIKTIVGAWRSFVLFLSVDGWICSLDIESASMSKGYRKHFLVPYGWHSTGAELLFTCTVKGHVVLARRDEIIVFQRGLDFEELVPL